MKLIWYLIQSFNDYFPLLEHLSFTAVLQISCSHYTVYALKKKITFQNLRELMKNVVLAALALPHLSFRRLQLGSGCNSAFSSGPGGRSPQWGWLQDATSSVETLRLPPPAKSWHIAYSHTLAARHTCACPSAGNKAWQTQQGKQGMQLARSRGRQEL